MDDKTEDTVTEASPLPKEEPPSGGSIKLEQLIDARYSVKRFIAKGGNCEVYEVEDTLVRQLVALKILQAGAARDEEANERFRREIQLARKITHENVCRIYDAGLHNGTPFFTMELLNGETLARRIARNGRLTTAEAIPIVKQVCMGLAAAHKAAVVHRDLKSANIMLVPAPAEEGGIRAVITDFGVARTFGVERNTFSTATGIIVGTPAYMAPEQIEGGDLTPRADIYALGVVLFEMVTATVPFSADLPLDTAEMRLREPPPSPRARVPDLDPSWEATILRCLALVPDERFSAVSEIPEALSVVDDSPTIVGVDSLPIPDLTSDVIPELPPPEYPGELGSEVVTVQPQPALVHSDIVPPPPILPKSLVDFLEGDGFPESTWIAYAAAFVAILIGGWLILRPRAPAWDGDLGLTTVPALSVRVPSSETATKAAATTRAPVPAPPAPRSVARSTPAPASAVAPAPAVAPAAPPQPAPEAAPSSAPTPKAGRVAAPVAAPARPKPPVVAAAPSTYDALMKEARAAYAARNFVKSIYRAEFALRERPGDQEALAIAAMAGCQLKNAEIAAKYLKNLKGQRANLVRQMCLTNRVAVR